MKKYKSITGISNHKKTLRVNILSMKKTVKLLDKIFTKMNFEYFFEEYDYKKGEYISIHEPKKFMGQTIPFFNEEETGFIIFKSKNIEIILLKDSKYFKKFEEELFSIFEFVNSPKIKTNNSNNSKSV